MVTGDRKMAKMVTGNPFANDLGIAHSSNIRWELQHFFLNDATGNPANFRSVFEPVFADFELHFHGQSSPETGAEVDAGKLPDYGKMEVIVFETGWASKGDQIG